MLDIGFKKVIFINQFSQQASIIPPVRKTQLETSNGINEVLIFF